MRNKKAILMIVVSAFMGLAAVVVAAQWLGTKAALATKKVVVAAGEIPLGTPLTPAHVRAIDWPSGSLPDGAFLELKALEGRVVRTTLQRGEPILESKLAPAGTRGGLASVISAGKRAVTVRVNEVIGVAGFALPGTLVDVMVNTRDERDRPVSKIVLEQILVLAVAQEASRDETKPKVVSAVTLELAPAQAEQLDLARSVGNLSLVLRNQLDRNVAATGGARKADLLAKEAAPTPRPRPRPVAARRAPDPAPRVAAAPAPKPERVRLELIKGVHKSSVEF